MNISKKKRVMSVRVFGDMSFRACGAGMHADGERICVV